MVREPRVLLPPHGAVEAEGTRRAPLSRNHPVRRPTRRDLLSVCHSQHVLARQRRQRVVVGPPSAGANAFGAAHPPAESGDSVGVLDNPPPAPGHPRAGVDRLEGDALGRSADPNLARNTRAPPPPSTLVVDAQGYLQQRVRPRTSVCFLWNFRSLPSTPRVRVPQWPHALVCWTRQRRVGTASAWRREGAADRRGPGCAAERGAPPPYPARTSVTSHHRVGHGTRRAPPARNLSPTCDPPQRAFPNPCRKETSRLLGRSEWCVWVSQSRAAPRFDCLATPTQSTPAVPAPPRGLAQVTRSPAPTRRGADGGCPSVAYVAAASRCRPDGRRL